MYWYDEYCKDELHRGAGMIFSWGGGNVDMPSDWQNLGVGAQAYPSH